ncbi:nitroreductase/quinone reductase family protein [Streptomyces sp. NPDC050610]|uniref:nitroreductase/quinone reductase family protein n=1 Tax=Streptomyces sp. NPDC050610 TaxID=3157097 RepID=UPI00344A50C6
MINPPIRLLLRMGLMPLGYALLETRGRSSGRPRTTPVGNGRRKDTFWIVAEHGQRAGYVRNIQRCPRVRVRLRQGWRFVWREGTAHLLPDDDPYARQRRLSRFHPLRALNAIVVRVMGSELMTVRIDLNPLPQRREHGAITDRAPASATAAATRSPRLRAGH